jgi:hypothetical protein
VGRLSPVITQMQGRARSGPRYVGLDNPGLRFAFCSPILCHMPEDEKQRGTLLIATCLIAAIRLRGEPILPSPKLKATIYDSVQLAVLLWREPQSRGSLPKSKVFADDRPTDRPQPRLSITFYTCENRECVEHPAG